jgi:hypothetical protein
MAIRVRKASGVEEDISPEKIRTSLIRSGASEDEADNVLDKVLRDMGPLPSTRKIHRLAQKYLRQINRSSGMRYSLKRAIFRLGPTGYPFEKYFRSILESHGYRAETGLIIEGRCVNHEVDVFALNETEVCTVECKYHNRPGKKVDVKVAMYVHSRFRDLGAAIAETHPHRRYRGMLVTNTRFTSDALKYAECSGLDVLSWRYPDKGSLEQLIESERLYPITIVSGIKSGLAERLIGENVVLLKELTDMEVDRIARITGLTERKANALKSQAVELCHCD